jgi:hypothetical protein
LIEIHVEVKLAETDDPFDDSDEESFESMANRRKDTKGQITTYAVAQLGLQFRTHIFSVLIFRKYARLIRWDRSGAVVTAAFDYCGSHLIDFFRRYDLASPAERGVDDSVSTPSDLEAAAAKAVLGTGSEHLVKFAVNNSQDNSVAYYIGSEPSFKANASLTGRSTRTFIVYDVLTAQRVVMKDTWRIDLRGMEKEGAIYECLHKAGVSNIAPFERGEDIRDHHTRTHDFVSQPWARPIPRDLRPHQQYRLVLGVVGLDLTSFKSSRQLVNAMADALQGESPSGISDTAS